MKFCINCEHYIPFRNAKDDGYCSRPQLGINLVTGEQNTKICSVQRMDIDQNYCGTAAQYFELKVVA